MPKRIRRPSVESRSVALEMDVPVSDEDYLRAREDGRAALRMIREAIELHGPPGILPSEERTPGPYLTDEAEVLVRAIVRLAETSRRASHSIRIWFLKEMKLRDAGTAPRQFFLTQKTLGIMLTLDEVRLDHLIDSAALAG